MPLKRTRKMRGKAMSYRPNPPQETHSGVDRPVKIEGGFDTAMDALLSVRPKKKSKRKKK